MRRGLSTLLTCCMALTVAACSLNASGWHSTKTPHKDTKGVVKRKAAQQLLQQRIKTPLHSPVSSAASSSSEDGHFWQAFLGSFGQAEPDNVWDELRQGFSIPHHESDRAVQAQIRWYMNHPSYLQRVTQRSTPYLYYVMQEVKRRGMPAELALLPFIESAYNPFVYSKVGAAGLWQLMPGTAKGLGVKHTWWYDGRRDITASTKAALDYLEYLHTFFDGDWLLAIAAYDTGEGNVMNSMRRNGRAGLPTDFWSLRLARETQGYVPRLLAFASIVAKPERYAVVLPPVKNSPYFAKVEVSKKIDLAHAARLADLSLDELHSLNPGYHYSALGPADRTQLLIPVHKVALFKERISRPDEPSTGHASLFKHVVKHQETWASIARQYRMQESLLREMNRAQSASSLEVGQILSVARTERLMPKESRHNPKMYLPPEARLKKIPEKRTRHSSAARSHGATHASVKKASKNNTITLKKKDRAKVSKQKPSHERSKITSASTVHRKAESKKTSASAQSPSKKGAQHRKA